jgi:hypothetical protein
MREEEAAAAAAREELTRGEAEHRQQQMREEEAAATAATAAAAAREEELGRRKAEQRQQRMREEEAAAAAAREEELGRTEAEHRQQQTRDEEAAAAAAAESGQGEQLPQWAAQQEGLSTLLLPAGGSKHRGTPLHRGVKRKQAQGVHPSEQTCSQAEQCEDPPAEQLRGCPESDSGSSGPGPVWLHPGGLQRSCLDSDCVPSPPTMAMVDIAAVHVDRQQAGRWGGCCLECCSLTVLFEYCFPPVICQNVCKCLLGYGSC